MASRAGFVLLLVAAAMVAQAAHAYTDDDDVFIGMGTTGATVDGHGLVADALEMEEMMMDSESVRRQLTAGTSGHICYGALGKNNVPCNHRGQSYYNCREHQQANPYQRSCTRATMCARNTH